MKSFIHFIQFFSWFSFLHYLKKSILNFLRGLFISSLRTSIIFIKTVLRSFYTSAILDCSGPAVVGYLGSSGDTLSCMLLCFYCGTWDWNDYRLQVTLLAVFVSVGLIMFFCSLISASSLDFKRV